MSWARACARELGLELVAGSFTEMTADGRRQNTSLHIGPDGEIRAIYRKIHMFDVTVEGIEYRESGARGPRRGDRASRAPTTASSWG